MNPNGNMRRVKNVEKRNEPGHPGDWQYTRAHVWENLHGAQKEQVDRQAGGVKITQQKVQDLYSGN